MLRRDANQLPKAFYQNHPLELLVNGTCGDVERSVGVMKGASCRQLGWGLLSFWATLSLLMPSLLWACPMMSQGARLEMRSCCAPSRTSHTAHRCCRPVSLPESDTTGDNPKGTPILGQAVDFAAHLSTASHTPSTPAILPMACEDVSKEIVPVSHPPTEPLLKPQHAPPLLAARAPPL